MGVEYDGKRCWKTAYGLYVAGLTEPLIGAVYTAEHMQMTMIIAPNGTNLVMPDGTFVPVDTTTGTTRCRHVYFGDGKDSKYGARRDNMALYDVSVTDVATSKHACSATGTVHVNAKAANLSERICGHGAEADERRFESWTKRLCGVSPEALSHMQANAVGCDAPDTVPNSRRDLRWYASAVAGKMRASSHSSLEPEAKHFRQVVGTLSRYDGSL